MIEKLYTLKQISEQTNVILKTLRNAIKKKKLEAASIGGQYLISASEWESFFLNQTIRKKKAA